MGEHYWADIDGYVTAHGGVPLRDMDIDRFVNLVWWFMTRNAEDEQKVDQLKEKLWRPPKGEEAKGVWSADAETAALDAAMKQLGG